MFYHYGDLETWMMKYSEIIGIPNGFGNQSYRTGDGLMSGLLEHKIEPGERRR